MAIMQLSAQAKIYTCVEEPESELENYPKEEKTHNKDELSKECDCYDGTIENQSYSVTFVSYSKGEKTRRLAAN